MYDLSFCKPPRRNADFTEGEKKKTSLSPESTSVTSTTLPVLSFENALMSNETVMGCTLEFITDLYMAPDVSRAYTEYEMFRRNNLLFGPFSNRITFSLISSPA